MSIKEFALEELIEEIEENWGIYQQRALDGQIGFDGGLEKGRIMNALIAELVRRMK